MHMYCYSYNTVWKELWECNEHHSHNSVQVTVQWSDLWDIILLWTDTVLRDRRQN